MAGSGTAHLRSERDDVLLRVEGLVKEYTSRGQRVQAVSDVSFDVGAGETLGLVGESGCGKSSTGISLLMLDRPTGGTVTFDGVDLTALGDGDLRKHRQRIQMVFQDPLASLNPRRRVRAIVAEALGPGASATDSRVDAALVEVGLDPEVHGSRRPHELSGGQCQRVGIARTLLKKPAVVVWDEPVSALDVSVQAQVLNLIRVMRREHRLTSVFIAHDLAVVKNISDRIAVMYLGKLCEVAPSDELCRSPRHPYTQALLQAVPSPDPGAPLTPMLLRGEPPSPLDPPSGCRFRTRCPREQALCATTEPTMTGIGDGHFVVCHFPLDATPIALSATPAGPEMP